MRGSAQTGLRKMVGSRKQHLRARIKYHYTGNAEGSTLRKTLVSCLRASWGFIYGAWGWGNRCQRQEGVTASTGPRTRPGRGFVRWPSRLPRKTAPSPGRSAWMTSTTGRLRETPSHDPATRQAKIV